MVQVLLNPLPGCLFYPVKTCEEMRAKVKEFFLQVDGLIMAAAPADFRPSVREKGKIKKESSEKVVLELVKNPDILEEMGKIKGKKILVGFCAETQNLQERARKKLKQKNLDLIVANDLTQPGAGFEEDTNKVIFIYRKGEVKDFPLMSKREVAREILNEVKKIMNDTK